MSRFSNYLQATAAEMKHVRWPTRQQALVYSALVIVISIIVSLYTAGFDYIFSSLLNLAI